MANVVRRDGDIESEAKTAAKQIGRLVDCRGLDDPPR